MGRYSKAKDWKNAKKAFKKAIGKTNYEEVEEVINSLDRIIEGLDEVVETMTALVDSQRRGKDVTDEMEELKHTWKDDLMDVLDIEDEDLEEYLLDNVDREYEDDIDDLVNELRVIHRVHLKLFNRITDLLDEHYLKSKRVSEEIANVKGRLTRFLFFQEEQFRLILGKANEVLDNVQDFLELFKRHYETLGDNPNDQLIAEYNNQLPSNPNGIRSITTHLGHFMDTEVFMESLKTVNSKTIRTVTNGLFDDYKTFKRYTKYAAFFIKKLSPFATAGSNLDPADFTDHTKQEISAEIATRLVTCKRLLTKLEGLYDNL